MSVDNTSHQTHKFANGRNQHSEKRMPHIKAFPYSPTFPQSQTTTHHDQQHSGEKKQDVVKQRQEANTS